MVVVTLVNPVARRSSIRACFILVSDKGAAARWEVERDEAGNVLPVEAKREGGISSDKGLPMVLYPIFLRETFIPSITAKLATF